MNHINRIFLLFPFLLFILSGSLLANNNLPKLTCYNKKDYHAGRQNWDVDIDKDGIVYFGNSEGLLYNIYGEWRFKTMSKKGIIRSVLADNDTIWCGGKEYGYFTKHTDDFIFHSLGELEYDQVWDIISFEDSIVYLSETQLIYYNKTNKSLNRYKFYPGIWSITKWRGKIWSVHKNGQIGYIENGILKNPTTLDELEKIETRKIFVHNNELYIVTLEGNVYSYDGKKIKTIPLPDTLKGKSLFSGMSFDHDSFCLATISEGFIQVNNKGELVNAVNAKNGLLDNTVLSMAEDELGNVWLGLDYGIAKIELQGPINQIFRGAATYDIKNFKGKTYIATNKGLFCSSKENGFQFIENSGGQIWTLKEINDELYSCNNNGFSKIKDNHIIPLTVNYTGVYDVANFEDTDYYLFSTYHGLILIKKVGNQFNYIKNLSLWGNKKLIYDKATRCIWGEFRIKTFFS